MATADEDQAQVDVHEKAAMLLKDRHHRESEALAALMAAVSRRARAEEIVERETEEIATRLTEMSRLGFDEHELTGLGLDVADMRASRATGMSEQPVHDGRRESDEPRTEGEPDGDTTGHRDAAALEANPSEHPGAVRTTAHLTGSLTNRSAGLNRRPW